VIHPPSALGEAVNVLAVEAVRQHPDKFCILGHFDLQSRPETREAGGRLLGSRAVGSGGRDLLSPA